jgi:urease accessory protein
MDERELTRLLLLADSAFPTGAFAHSWGLEWAVRRGWVTGGADLASWIRTALRFGVAPLEGRAVARALQLARHTPPVERTAPSFAPAPGRSRARGAGAPAGQSETVRTVSLAEPLAREAGAAAERTVVRRLVRLSDEVASFLPSREARAAGGQLGRSLLIAAGAAFSILRWSSDYAAALQATRDGDQRLQHPVAWGLLGGTLGIGAGALVQAYLLSTVRQWAQVAMRTVPIGQSEALGVVGGLLDEVTELARGTVHTRNPLAAITPGWDLAVLGHGELSARYFRS